MKTVLHFVLLTGSITGALLVMAAILHLVPRLGDVGKRLSDFLCRAPALDVIVTYFTVLPLFVGPYYLRWLGLLAAIIGQVGAVLIWVYLHERVHRQAVQGPRIVSVLNRLIGPWRNHAALWLTAAVTPMFWLVRMVEVFLYPPLRYLVGFPKYRSGDWVNVSRHKFSNLVGHDLIWCLYCDWMTGIWSLGTEMLRNVESFWCPIRFDNTKKCENCAVDFPDLNGGWVDAHGDMADVTRALENAHGAGNHSWFGHPVRVTVNGKTV